MIVMLYVCYLIHNIDELEVLGLGFVPKQIEHHWNSSDKRCKAFLNFFRENTNALGSSKIEKLNSNKLTSVKQNQNWKHDGCTDNDGNGKLNLRPQSL